MSGSSSSRRAPALGGAPGALDPPPRQPDPEDPEADDVEEEHEQHPPRLDQERQVPSPSRARSRSGRPSAASVSDQDRGRLAGEHEEDHGRGDPIRGDQAVTIRAKLYAAIVLTILGPAGDDRRGAARDVRDGRPLRRGAPERRARGARPRDQVLGHRHERLADGLRLRRRPLPRPLPGLGGEAPRRPRRRRPRRSPTRPSRGSSSRCSRTSAASWSSTRSPGTALQNSDPAPHQTDPARARAAAVRDDGRHRGPARRPRGAAGDGDGELLRRGSRRRPQAADRGRARRRRGDHPAARHRERHREDGARGRAPRPRDGRSPNRQSDETS